MKILIAVDGSANSKYAFRQAKRNIFTEKDHVFVLTVCEGPTSYPFEDILNFNNNVYEEMNQKMEAISSDLLRQFGRKLTKLSVPHTCLIAKGAVKDVICKQAQDLGVDMVVMGRRGLGKLERTFIGSTSQYCVHNISCSVLVIPENSMNSKQMPSPSAVSDSPLKEQEKAMGKEDKEKWKGKEEKSKEDKGLGSKEELKFEEGAGKMDSVRSDQCDDPKCTNPLCNVHSEGLEEKWKGKEKKIVGSKEDLKYEGGAGKLERSRSDKCDDPKCVNPQCDVHGEVQKAKDKGKKSKEDLKHEGGAGKLERIRSDKCDDPKCSNSQCDVHGDEIKRKSEQRKVNEKEKEKKKDDKGIGSKEDLKYEGGAGKLERIRSDKCDDPKCSNTKCDVHGDQVKKKNEGSGLIEGQKSYAAVVEANKDKASPEPDKQKDTSSQEPNKQLNEPSLIQNQ